MKMINDDVKRENRKALPKYLLILLGAAVFGGVLGFVTSFAEDLGAAETVTAGINAFLRSVGPWAIPVYSAVLLGAGFGLYCRAKRDFAAWDGDDEILMDGAEEKLNWTLLLSTLTLLLDFFFLAASTASLFPDGGRTALVMAGWFVLSVAAVTVQQQRVVDLTKRMNPEKRGSIYDVKFHKKWMDSCDEAERAQIGQASYQAYRTMNVACPLLWAILLCGNFVFGYGLLPTFVVVLLWGILQVSYILECIRMEKRKK